MEQKLLKALRNNKYIAHPDLSEQIWRNIIMHDRRIARLKLWAFSTIGLLSFVGFVPVFQSLLSSLSQSGFYEYFSLIFSEGSTLINYGGDFLLLLAESLPTTSIITSLLVIFVFLLSLKFAAKQIRQIGNIKLSKLSMGIRSTTLSF